MGVSTSHHNAGRNSCNGNSGSQRLDRAVATVLEARAALGTEQQLLKQEQLFSYETTSSYLMKRLPPQTRDALETQ
jgi:hypothetical protein